MAEANSKPGKGESPSYQPLVVVLAAACTGIVLDWGYPTGAFVWLTLAAGALIAWLGLWRCGWNRAAAVLLLLAIAASAATWHHCRWCLFAPDDLGCHARLKPQPACVEAIVLKGPRRLPAPRFDPMRIIPQGDRTRTQLRIVGIRDGSTWRPASGRATLMVEGHLLGVHAGDRLRIFAQLVAPSMARNPGEFNRADYERAQRRRSFLRCNYPDCVSVVQPASGLSPRAIIDRTRAGGDRLLWRYIDDRRAALAAAVLLGAREQLGAEESETFRETGTVHLLAISGLHVGIVAGALLLLLRLMLVPRRPTALIVAIFVVLYTVLTDARPPAIRATILVLVACLSYCLERRQLSLNSLAAAALVVLAMNPTDLFSTGAQLSFLAVTAIMWFAPRWVGSGIGSAEPPADALDQLVAKSRGPLTRAGWLVWKNVRGMMLIAAIIWLVTMPLTMARFHLLAPIALPLNALLWLPMAAALVSGLGVLTFGVVFPPLAAVCGWVCDGSLWLLQSCIAIARDVPGSHFWVPGPADWWLIGLYGTMALLAAWPAIRPPRRWCLALLAGWSALGLGVSALRPDGDRLDCTFLSVGHGLAVVVELPSGRTMLYDAGRFGPPVSGAQTIASCLWSRGTTHLDAVVLSHADADHYNALPELLKRISVGVIYVSPVMFEGDGRALAALEEAIRRADVPIRQIHSGDRLQVGYACRIEVLHPPRRGVIGSDNANNLTLEIEYLGKRVLLTGDLESPGLDDLMAEEPIDCDLLLAPHHGSLRSNPTGLAAWCHPEWVVISGGHNERQQAATAAYRQAGAQVLHTAKHGAVRVTMDATGIKVESFLDGS